MNRLGFIGGDDPMDRLMRQVIHYCGPDVFIPDTEQVAAVLHALADHTTLLQAVRYSGTDEVALNVGRFLHAYGDTLQGR